MSDNCPSCDAPTGMCPCGTSTERIAWGVVAKIGPMLRTAEDELAALRSDLARVTAERDDYRARKDAAYDERNNLVAALARLAIANGWRAGIGKHCPDPDPTWDVEWLNVIYIETPWGQLSWHIHDRQLALFDGLPLVDITWDGHTTDEKYDRLANAWRIK
jgi:hypothetical protein